MAEYYDLECSDSRDHIYALLGMCKTPAGMLPMMPNYQHGPLQVLLQVIPYLADVEKAQDWTRKIRLPCTWLHTDESVMPDREDERTPALRWDANLFPAPYTLRQPVLNTSVIVDDGNGLCVPDIYLGGPHFRVQREPDGSTPLTQDEALDLMCYEYPFNPSINSFRLLGSSHSLLKMERSGLPICGSGGSVADTVHVDPRPYVILVYPQAEHGDILVQLAGPSFVVVRLLGLEHIIIGFALAAGGHVYTKEEALQHNHESCNSFELAFDARALVGYAYMLALLDGGAPDDRRKNELLAMHNSRPERLGIMKQAETAAYA